MNLARKRNVVFTVVLTAAFLLSLNNTVSAQFWHKKEDKNKKSKSEVCKSEAPASVRSNEAAVEEPAAPAVPFVPPIPPKVPKISAGLAASKIPVVDPTISLESIKSTQRELELLATRYEDLKTSHEEQLISIRALASQAKIHAQLLDGLKDKLITVPNANVRTETGLDASSLEKYRLIRERMAAQQKAIQDINESQQRLKIALAATNLPNPPPAIRLPPGANAAVPSSLDAIKKANELKMTQSALESAKETKERAVAEAEKRKAAEEKKQEAKT